jgi:hypothetical protein
MWPVVASICPRWPIAELPGWSWCCYLLGYLDEPESGGDQQLVLLDKARFGFLDKAGFGYMEEARCDKQLGYLNEVSGSLSD